MVFFLIAVAISVILIYIVINFVGFMENTIETTSDLGTGGKSSLIRFNFDKLREIGIIKG